MRPDKAIPFPDLNLPTPDPDSNDDLPDDDDYDEDQRKPPDSYRDWWYHSDHLGSSTYLTDNFGRPSHYYETLPFGEMIVEHNQSTYNGGQYENAYKFNGKELDDATQMYYYGARYYDPRISIFVSVDPLAEETMTPYQYVYNNPIMFTDPTGMAGESTDVIKNDDGTYKVVGGNLNDNDKGIYVVDSNGERTGEKIGESLTMYSFYNADYWDAEEGKKIGWVGTIDPKSNESGKLVSDFIKKAETIFIGKYMFNATDGKDFDFKRDGDPENNDRDFHHRGSVWATKSDGTKIYGTARDAGNYSAGYISAINGLTWGQARWGFDALEQAKSGNNEGPQSTQAQRAGFDYGTSVRPMLNARRGRAIEAQKIIISTKERWMKL